MVRSIEPCDASASAACDFFGCFKQKRSWGSGVGEELLQLRHVAPPLLARHSQPTRSLRASATHPSLHRTHLVVHVLASLAMSCHPRREIAVCQNSTRPPSSSSAATRQSFAIRHQSIIGNTIPVLASSGVKCGMTSSGVKCGMMMLRAYDN